jgi:hypothetical protein
MKFLIKSNAYVNMPMHLQNDPPGVIRQVPQLIKAEPSQPVVLELPDDVDLDTVSSRWEPLDETATKAQARLRKLGADRRAAAKALADAAAAGDAAEVAPKPLDAAGLLDALKALPEDVRAQLFAAAQAKPDAAAGTMSGALAKQVAGQPGQKKG